MKGRKPKPAHLKVLTGTLARGGAPRAEARAPHGAPPMPRGLLDAEGQRAYRQLAKAVGPNGRNVVTRADGLALYLLADAISEYICARRVVRDSGQTYEAQTRYGTTIRRRPEVAIANEAGKRARALLAEFGLTPSSATRVTGLPAETSDEFDDLFS